MMEVGGGRGGRERVRRKKNNNEDEAWREEEQEEQLTLMIHRSHTEPQELLPRFLLFIYSGHSTSLQALGNQHA